MAEKKSLINLNFMEPITASFNAFLDIEKRSKDFTYPYRLLLCLDFAKDESDFAIFPPLHVDKSLTHFAIYNMDKK